MLNHVIFTSHNIYLLQANFIFNQEVQKNGSLPSSKKRLSEEDFAEVKRRKKENDRLRKVSPIVESCISQV